MARTPTVAKKLAGHVDQVVALLAVDIGIERAIVRVMERLAIVLQDALEGGRQRELGPNLDPKPFDGRNFLQTSAGSAGIGAASKYLPLDVATGSVLLVASAILLIAGIVAKVLK